MISDQSGINFLEKNDQGLLQLNCNHNYFYQIQGQMAISEKKKCILVVYTLKDLKIFPIEYDENFVNLELIPRLNKFYAEIYLPFLRSKL